MQITISVGESRKSENWTPHNIDWESFKKKLSQAQTTPETMAEYAAMDREARVQAKDIGGFIGGYLKGPRKLENVKNR